MKMIKNSKLLLKIFSAFIAVVLWFAVTYTEDPSLSQHISRLDTVFYNEDTLARKGLVVVDKDELPSFSVTIRGKRSKVISSLEKVSACIDVADITSAGEHEVDVDYIYPTDSVMLTKAKLSTVTVKTEKLISREIPVKITSRPTKKSKNHIIESESHLDSVTISGAQSVMNKVAYAVVIIDESDITSPGTSNYPFVLYSADGDVLEEKNIASKSHSAVAITHTIHNKVELPVKVVLSDELKNEYSLTVEQQEISKIYAGVKEDADVTHLEAIFEREHIDAEEDTVTLTVKAPDGVYIPQEDREIKVKCDVSKKATFEVDVPVSAKNVPDGFSVSMNPGKIKVRVKCSKEDAKANNITAILDAKNLSRGGRENVILTVTAKDDMQVLGTYTTSATLN